LYASSDVIRIIKSRRLRWAANLARLREMRNAYSILVGKPEGGDHFVDIGIDGKIILERIFGKYGEGVWTGFI
jgi:hypothetical protein